MLEDSDLVEYMGRDDRSLVEAVVQGAGSPGGPGQPIPRAGKRGKAHRLWQEAYLHRWCCRHVQADATAQEGVRLGRAAGDRLLEAMCRREVGLAARTLGEYGRARGELELALGGFDALGEPGWQVHTLGNLATLSWYEGAPERSLDLSRRALERCEAAGLTALRRLPLGDMGAAAVALGAPDLARECLGESLSLAHHAGDRSQEVLCRTHLGWLAVRLRRASDAEEEFRAGLALAAEIGSCIEQAWLLAGLAEAERLANKTGPAVAHARQALKQAQASGAAYDQKLALWVLGRLGEVRQGDAERL